LCVDKKIINNFVLNGANWCEKAWFWVGTGIAALHADDRGHRGAVKDDGGWVPGKSPHKSRARDGSQAAQNAVECLSCPFLIPKVF
jgi:phage gp29-like protein